MSHSAPLPFAQDMALSNRCPEEIITVLLKKGAKCGPDAIGNILQELQQPDITKHRDEFLADTMRAILKDPEQRANFAIDGKDANGKTPLEVSYEMGRAKLFTLLTEEGARTDLPFSTGVCLRDAIKEELQTGMRTLDELSHHEGHNVTPEEQKQLDRMEFVIRVAVSLGEVYSYMLP